MDRILQSLSDPSWWFSNIGIALLISLVAVPIHSYLTKTLARRAIKRQINAVFNRAKFNANLELLKLKPELAVVALIDLHNVGILLIGSFFAFLAITYLAIDDPIRGASIWVANLLGPLGAALFMLGTYIRYLRLSVLLAAYKEWALSEPGPEDA